MFSHTKYRSVAVRSDLFMKIVSKLRQAAFGGHGLFDSFFRVEDVSQGALA